jgi:LuxR family maltose regulon positive regulatory protein
MAVPLIKTKIRIPPVQAGFIWRPHLIEQLERGQQLGHRLSLIAAPAGFGKTNLACTWLDKHNGSVAWISLDEDDNDPGNFWTYLIASLQTTYQEIGNATLALLQSPQIPPAKTLLTPLVNEVAACSEPIILVLDDYHVISNPEVHAGITFLIDYLPDGFHILISTRANPPLSIARLRAQGSLTEIRAEHLRFTTDEAGAFLNKIMGLNLSLDDVQALEARTEGWIVGLHLAALSMLGREDKHEFISTFSGSHHYILEYLTGEVLSSLPAQLRRFLLQTSVLERFCAELCKSVTGESDSEGLLSELQHNHLFIVPLDDERQWFRYHHLFKDLLFHHLQTEVKKEDVYAFREKASRWHAARLEFEVGIKYALGARDFESAAGLIEQAAGESIAQGKVITLLRWIEALPKDIVLKSPRLRMYQGYAIFLTGQVTHAREVLQDARSLLQTAAPFEGRELMFGRLLALLATLTSLGKDIDAAIDQAQEALKNLPESELVWRARAARALGVSYGFAGDTTRMIQVCEQAKALAIQAGNRFLATEITSQIVTARIIQGKLRQASDECERILEVFDYPDKDPPAGLAYIRLAEIALNRNDLAKAQDYLDKGIELCVQGGIGYTLLPAYCMEAILKQEAGDTRAALQAIQIAERMHREGGSMESALVFASFQMRLRLLLNDIESARKWACGDFLTVDWSTEDLPIGLREFQSTLLARVHLAENQPMEILALYELVCETARPGGRMAWVLELSLYKALALQMLGDSSGALEAIAQSLSLAAPEGYTRLFLEAGASVVTLLKQAASQGIYPDYAHKLLTLFGVPDLKRIDESAISTSAQPILEPLSPRELEVLKLISTGHTNQEIADSLFVSLNTIKKHTSHIYGKLGVKNRAQAIARARVLGLDQ